MYCITFGLMLSGWTRWYSAFVELAQKANIFTFLLELIFDLVWWNDACWRTGKEKSSVRLFLFFSHGAWWTVSSCTYTPTHLRPLHYPFTSLSYLIIVIFLHWHNFWSWNFTPKFTHICIDYTHCTLNAWSKMINFHVQSGKIYTGQKYLHWRRQPRQRQLSGMLSVCLSGSSLFYWTMNYKRNKQRDVY